ncbi:MAG: SprB repeat-containing protein [Bacteroidetes bacterium]|nr:SprB repeat-containing protein [Bacteroidota bacterium]
MQPTPLAVNTNVVDANCGNANGAVTINANGGTAPYQYSIDNGATFQASNNFSSLLANNYNIVIEDANGCTLNGNAAVNNLAAPVINATPFVNILCNGGKNGSITINANGGTGALQYSIDGGTTFSANNVFNNLLAGNYNIVVTDAASCQAASAVVIVEPTQLALVPNVTGSTCSASNGSIVINANGGTAPYQYSNNNGATFQAANSFNNIASGAYQLVVRDANGCMVNVNANVTDAPAAVITNVAPTNLTCNGSNDGAITITANGGTAPLQYSINNGTTYQAGNQFANLAIGNYSIIVQDANGCTVANGTNIIQPAAIVINSNSVNANCGQADGSLTINANGGTGALQYSINGGLTFQATGNFSNIVSGNYNIVVQDANGCTQTSAGVVNSNAAPAITNVTAVDIDCNGANNGTITITANGGTGLLQYSINNGTAYQAGNNFINLAPGNYTIAVIDAVGCVVNNAAIIAEPPVLITNANTVTSTCGLPNGSVTINANGGTAPLQYSNNSGATYQGGNNFVGLASGNYQIVVLDANGCTSSLNANVASAPAAVINNVNANDISCNGLTDGSIAITTSGGTAPLQFSIDNGATYQPASSFNNLGAGNYQIVVQDANGCLTNSNAAIVQPAAIILNSNTVNSNCNQADGSLTVNANGGTALFNILLITVYLTKVVTTLGFFECRQL